MTIKVKLKPGAVQKLLKLPEMERDLLRRAKAIAAAAGPGMEPDSSIGKTRARASVHTATWQARRAEAHGRALTAAIDHGRT